MGLNWVFIITDESHFTADKQTDIITIYIDKLTDMFIEKLKKTFIHYELYLFKI